VIGWAVLFVLAMPPTSGAARSAPEPQDSRSSAGRAYFGDCAAARAAGAAPLKRGEPGYRSALDRDSDGVACEPYRGRGRSSARARRGRRR
jgi:hypothetical protein